MTAGGWIIMVGSVGSVIGLFGWCLAKVLSTSRSSAQLHSPLDIETPDSVDQT